jgi:glycosyltransferase involved in cell wall biosynthesis
MSDTPPVARPLDASVIVCTFNRAASLGRTLRALQAQQVRAGVDWELLVVDNNSRDDTRRVVEGFAQEFPRTRYCFEQRQGLSHARNHGIAAARGQVLLFTDDDVAPEPDWIERILDGMAASGCIACGGFIAPAWETPPPAWLTERFHGFLAVRAERTDTYPITREVQPPFGANMAFRREVFERFGLFDVTRGRNGSVLASGEDGELFERIIAAGEKVMFFGDARVHHTVESFRVTRRYFRRWRYQTSRNLAESRGQPANRKILGVPPYLAGQLVRALWRALVARLSEPADVAFHREMIAWHFLGTIEGLWRRHKAQARSVDADGRGK